MTTAMKISAAAGTVLLAGVMTFTGLRLWWKTKPAPNEIAQVPAANPRPAEVALHVNNWQVRYHDADLGTVEGTAVVDWAQGRAAVRLDDPSGSGKAFLTADDVEIDKSSTLVTMRLRGASPAAARVIAPSTTGMRRISAAEGQQLIIKPAQPSFSETIMDKALPDADGVRLSLRAQNFGALTGEWSYRADPITKRNAGGSGRTGYFRLLNDDELDDAHAGFIGEQSGREEWWPLPAEIACVAVMEEQLASKTDLAEYYYPFSGASRVSTERQKTRTLFVAGRNFPADRGRVLQEVYNNDYLSYRVVALSTDPDLSASNKGRIEEGWNKTLQLLNDEMKQIVRTTLDAAIIVVELKEGVLPGPKQFTWGDAAGAWFLQFGENRADLRFVRPIRLKTAGDSNSKDEYESTPMVFLPETLAVEVETRFALPLPSIPVRIAATAAPGRLFTKTATRVPGRVNLYRTELFSVSPLVLHPGDLIRATVQMDDVAFIAPPAAQVSVLLTPDQARPDAKVRPDPATPAGSKVKLWKESLALAARADRVPVENFATLAGHSLSPYQGLRMTVGDHAAMLLLRSAFLEMLEEHKKYLDSIKSDDDNDIEAFREWLRPFLADSGPLRAEEADPGPYYRPRFIPAGFAKYDDYLQTIEDMNALRVFLLSLPFKVVKGGIEKLRGRDKPAFGKGTYFGELEVPDPWDEGGTCEYFTTYWPVADFPRDWPYFLHDPGKLRNWRLKATRAVLSRYRASVDSTIARVNGILDSDTQALLKLTGVAFGAVVARTLPQLMRYDDPAAPGRWTPDLPARGAVGHLYVFAAAARAAEDYSNLKDRSLLEIASQALAWGAPGLLFSEATAAALTSVAGWGLLAWQVGDEITDQLAIRRDVDLFFGASGVLGVDRLEETNARKLTIGDVVEQLATQLAIDHVWGEIQERTAPIAPPRPNQGRMPVQNLFAPAVVFAADPPRPPGPRRMRGFGAHIRRELGAISAERMLPRMQGLTLEALKQWPKEQVQRFLLLAAAGGAKLEIGGVATLEQVQAVAAARRLKREIDHAVDPGEAKAAINFGDTTQTLGVKPPDGGKNGLPGLQAGAAVPAKKVPVPGQPAAVAIKRGLPLAGNPPRDNSWITVTEADGKTVYYKSTGIDKDGKPIRLGHGASSDVYGLTKVDNRSTNILEDDGAVLKVMRYDKDFGTPREQIRRIKESYELLKAAKDAGSSIEFAEILEFHEDANPPYLIQRRLHFDGTTCRQVDSDKLIQWVQGKAKPLPLSETEFPRDLRKAVAKLHFDLAYARLLATDLSLPNIYFRKIGGQWVAGILDIDHLVHAKRPADPSVHFDWDQVITIRDAKGGLMPSTVSDGRELKTTFDFMEKALELQHGGNRGIRWIEYKNAVDMFVQGLIEPEVVAEVFREFRVRGLRSKAPRKQSSLQPIQPWPRMYPAPLAG